MTLDDDAIIRLGEFCEQVLNAPQFAALVHQYELQVFSHFTSTKPENKNEREFIFATMRGLRDFVGHMADIATQKQNILKAIDAELSQADARQEDFED